MFYIRVGVGAGAETGAGQTFLLGLHHKTRLRAAPGTTVCRKGL